MTDSTRRWRHRAPLPQGAIDAGQVILRDGSTADLRTARSEDEHLLRDLLDRISPAARHHRFFGNVSSDTAAKRLVRHGPPEHRVALLVLTGEGDDVRVIAHGEYTLEGDERAEVAFLVDDGYQGKGLGTLLLERLALVAARHGIRTFHAATEPGNVKMRDVFLQSGFPVVETREDGELEVAFSIEPSAESVHRAEMRERVATVASLRPFLRPASVAFVGDHDAPDGIGRRILENLRASGFRGSIFVTEGAPQSEGSRAELPEGLDLTVVGVEREQLLGTIERCGERGVRAVALVGDGGAGGAGAVATLAPQAARVARRHGMRLLGPGSLGLINTAVDVRLNASVASSPPEHGPVALASQSGALGLASLAYARDVGVGLSSFVSLGGKADVSGNDVLQYWEDDPETGVILLYLESFGNPRRFARLARRVGRSKPIVAVKAGGSSAGLRATASRTASLVASEAGTEALFRQTGIIRVDGVEAMFDTAYLLASGVLPAGPRVAVITNAGGPAILAVDALEAAGMEAPVPSHELTSALLRRLPTGASAANPVDLDAGAEPQHYRGALEAVLASGEFDAVMVLFAPTGRVRAAPVAEAVHEALDHGPETEVGLPVVASFLGDARAPARVEPLAIPSYRFPGAAARALGRAHAYASWLRRPVGRTPEHEDVDLDKARAVVANGATDGGWLPAPAVAELLRAFGIPLLAQRFARDAEETVAAAASLGHPVAVKMASRTLIRKSEWGGVRLDLTDGAEVREACHGILHRLERAQRAEELDGFVVQRMAPQGTELMMGMAPDPLFGPLLAFGLGGVQFEALRDVAFRITPLTDRDAADMVRSIRAYRLLEGYRGAPAADTSALEDVLLRLSRLVDELPGIVELDLNPVRALEEGCVVLDARVRVAARPPTEDG